MTVSVTINDDTSDENDEALILTLSNASSAEIEDAAATGTIRDNDTTATPLAASFKNLPANHDGSSEFTFQVEFSEDVGISYTVLRDDGFTVTNGDVTGARRVNGRNDLWQITVEPDGRDDVTITLPGNRDCGTRCRRAGRLGRDGAGAGGFGTAPVRAGRLFEGKKMAYNPERRRRLLAAGLCAQCGRQPISPRSRSRCATCLYVARQYTRGRRAVRRVLAAVS